MKGHRAASPDDTVWCAPVGTAHDPDTSSRVQLRGSAHGTVRPARAGATGTGGRTHWTLDIH
jgi:hypothetical protein